MDKVNHSKGHSVAAVVATYGPGLERLGKLLKTLQRQVDLTLIVDNGSIPALVEGIRSLIQPGQVLLPLPENMGIAAAQNAGFVVAAESGAKFILFLDQDSLPPDGMAKRLKQHILTLQQAGEKVAAIGPQLVDDRWDSQSRLRQRGRNLKLTHLQRVDHLIASGSMVPIETLFEVGGMREELFIDFVDIEWGLRARRLGFSSYVADDILMEHQLGSPLNILGRTISTHTPMRHYYLARNGTWLLRQRSLPLSWRCLKLPKVALHLLLNALFARPHKEHWQMMVRGVVDGLAGKMGRRGHE